MVYIHIYAVIMSICKRIINESDVLKVKLTQNEGDTLEKIRFGIGASKATLRYNKFSRTANELSLFQELIQNVLTSETSEDLEANCVALEKAIDTNSIYDNMKDAALRDIRFNDNCELNDMVNNILDMYNIMMNVNGNMYPNDNDGEVLNVVKKNIWCPKEILNNIK